MKQSIGTLPDRLQLSEKRKQEITRRAQSDAQALRSGGPVNNPYISAEDADEWKKQFDLAVAMSKAKR